MDKILYNKLLTLKSRLKTNFTENGRSPIICSDESIKEMASYPPQKISDFYAIKGIGDTFINKYAEYFLYVINAYTSSNTKIFDKDMEVTLFNLENRLVNISQSNKLLYLNRLYPKIAIDLFCENEEQNKEILDLVLNKKTKVQLCNTQSNSKQDVVLYKKLSVLIREINATYKETGENNLFIAYPFVRAYFKQFDFRVNAPLMLFPVSLDKKSDKITLVKDNSRDILYNTHLILLINKLQNRNKELPTNSIEDFDSSSFITEAKLFFEANDIVIQNELTEGITKFDELTEKTFPKDVINFTLVNNAVIGKFSLCDNAIQRDLRSMINSNRISGTVENLLKDIDEIDMIEDDNAQTSDYVFDENNTFYVNELNTSQENVLSGIEKNNELVIKGPPGTGKSQTITSIIADFVCKDKNVLVVSQKKVALEVIYSRLGLNSKYAMFIDSANSKDSFYSRLYKILTQKDMETNCLNSITIKNEQITTLFNKLNTIKSSFSKTFSTDYSILDVYAENFDNYFSTNSEKLNDFFEITGKSFLNFEYNELKEIFNKFANQEFLDSYLKYIDISNKYFYLKDVKQNLLTVERNSLIKDVKEFSTTQKEFLQKNFIYKIFHTAKRKKELKNIITKYFTTKQNFKFLYKNPDNLASGITNLDYYFKHTPDYLQLTNNEKDYLKFLYKATTKNIDDSLDINKLVFDCLIYCKLENFEMNNQPAMNYVNSYIAINNEINTLIKEKIDLVKQLTFGKLVASANKIKLSKRYLEILRQCENKHKRDISKFVEKYSYELLQGIKIWLMTPESVSEILPLKENLFDVIVFDEASQIYIEKSLPSIARAKKVVVSGDNKQLRPSSLGFGRIDTSENDDDFEEVGAALEEESLLDLARFKYPQVMLNYHYRSKYQELIEFSNYAFYNGNINVSPNKANNVKPIEVIKINNGLWEKRTNKAEARKVVELVKNLLKTRQKKETIGIVTFNVSQQDLIQDLLEDECVKDVNFASIYKKECERRNSNGEDESLFVKNIENVQGDERDIIIFSTTYAKDENGKLIRNFGWLNQKTGENRLNVAISRAKLKIYIVTSILSSELQTDDLKNNGPKLLKKYLEYCEALSSNNYDLAKTILNSLTNKIENKTTLESENIKKDLKESLQNLGYIVDENVGVGNYILDLALKDNENNYYMVIEFSNKILTNNTNIREIDINREKFLNVRGFKYYKVWENLYYHNKENILEDIVKLSKSKA